MDSESLKTCFDALAATWREDTRFDSSASTRAVHWSYQQIIGMGKEALPFIFKELRKSPDNPPYWFWALAAITRANPVPYEDRGKFVKMTKHWLRWASENGYEECV